MDLFIGFVLGVTASLTAAAIVASVSGRGWVRRRVLRLRNARRKASRQREQERQEQERRALAHAKAPLVNQVVTIAKTRQVRRPVKCVGEDWGGCVYEDTLGDHGYWDGSKDRPIESWSDEELRRWIDRHAPMVTSSGIKDELLAVD